MSPHLPIYLTTHRKRWGLSLAELGFLLGVGKKAVWNYEARTRRPSRELLIAAEVIFGAEPRDIFPADYGAVEDQVFARAKELYARLEGRTDLQSLEKLKLLESMVQRAQASSPEL